MLDGTDPARILCLTFTRAAAAEMANRINQRLAAWTTLPPGQLAEELVELTGRFPQEYEIARARQLFAAILDVPGGAKIATIHAFCQSLLAPLSRSKPACRPNSPSSTSAAPRKPSPKRPRRSSSPRAPEPSRGSPRRWRSSPSYAPEERFIELMTALADERGKLREALAQRRSGVAPAAVRGARRCRNDATPGQPDRGFLRPAATTAGSARRRRGARRGLRQPTRNAARSSRAGARTPAERRDLLDALYRGLPDREERDPPKPDHQERRRRRRHRPIRRACCRPRPSASCASRPSAPGLALIEATVALIRLGDALLRAYERRKRLHGLLDYDDLVLKALDLLRRPGVAPWVLFKLDGGLDHILIDEAQDTNPEQWAIVAALAEEFFAGEGAGGERVAHRLRGRRCEAIDLQLSARRPARLCARCARHFEARVTAAKQAWRVVPLEISFRAAEPLLQAVDAVFRARRRGRWRRARRQRHPPCRGARRPGRARRAVAAGVARQDDAGSGRRRRPAPPRGRAAHPPGARDRRDDRAVAGARRAAGAARPGAAARRCDGAGAPPQRLCRRSVARVESRATCRSPGPIA